MPEPPEETERKVRLAERQHDEHLKRIALTFDSVITFASESLKAAALINGGSAAATLALISQVLVKRPDLAKDMIFPLRIFAVGLFLAVIATGCGYFAQLFFQEHGSRHEFHFLAPPWVRPKRRAVWWLRSGRLFQGLAIVLVLSAWGLALWGFLLSANALSDAAKLAGAASHSASPGL